MKMIKTQSKRNLVWIEIVDRWFWVTPVQARRLAKALIKAAVKNEGSAT